ncbi:hypothetical protein BU17DRAFT_67635 [Hysterangium stoloniferum]|nr:hypothetical protein BU17DRAFT_67635 [Hysterangium stoloniferum]
MGDILNRSTGSDATDRGLLSLTDDVNVIVREIDLAHPAANNMIELAGTKHEAVGDGTISVIILALDMYCRKEDAGIKMVDIKQYIRVETVSSGEIEQSWTLDTIMINKSMTYSAMRRRIIKPQLIFGGCPLEYKKGEDLAQDVSNITAIRRVHKSDNNRAACAVGATIVNRVGDLQEADVGTQCGLSNIGKLGDKETAKASDMKAYGPFETSSVKTQTLKTVIEVILFICLEAHCIDEIMSPGYPYQAYHFSFIDNQALMPITTDSLPNTHVVHGINRMDDVAGLPPTVPPSGEVTTADSQLSDEKKTAVKIYKMLREQWGCNEPGHDLCLQGTDYIGHMQLSEEQIFIWIDKICRGQATCHYPPDMFIVPDGPRSNRNPNFDWSASETNTDSEVEIGPGRLYKPASERSLGIILQETADLMRPSYPLYIRKRASNIFGRTTRIPDEYRGDDCIQIILEWLGNAFRRSGEDHVSPEIISALYRHLTSAPLHVHYDEVLSNFIVTLARYLTGAWERDYDSLPYTLGHLMRNLCRLLIYVVSILHTELTNPCQIQLKMVLQQ